MAIRVEMDRDAACIDGPDAIDLHEFAERVASREDFARFMNALREDLERELTRPPQETAWCAGDSAHTDLDGFLETWAAWLEGLSRDSPQWPSYGRTLESLDPRAWPLFAKCSFAARVHE
jgi:hypothetical protein